MSREVLAETLQHSGNRRWVLRMHLVDGLNQPAPPKIRTQLIDHGTAEEGLVLQRHLDEQGIYHSAHDDPALFPLVRLKGGEHNRFTCYVYEYGITAILDDKLPGEAMTARFD